MSNRETDEQILDTVDEIMEMLQELPSPEDAALVLLACHAANYELNANKGLDMAEYLALYDEQFKGFFERKES